MKITLQKKASGNNYSIEAGLHDGIKQFDHHGIHSNNPAPCNNAAIPVIPEDSEVEITHTDADTLLGLMRMLGKPMPSNLDLSVVEKIDLNGSSVVGLESDELAYMVAINDAAQNVFVVPRTSDVSQDVTQQVLGLVGYMSDSEKIVADGKKLIEKAEKEFRSVERYYPRHNANVVAFKVPKEIQFDPSRPYRDGIDIVVVFREAYDSVSLYANPKTQVDFLQSPVYANFLFCGHKKACGSERGKKLDWNDAVAISLDVASKFL